jgi:hypothetical protein
MGETSLYIKNVRKSIDGKSIDYAEIDLIDVIYDLVEAKKFQSSYIDKNAIKNLRPINGVHSGYFTTKINWTDPRDNKEYFVSWDSDDENDRLTKIREMNLRVQDYLDFVENEKLRVGIEEALKWHSYGLYNEWLLGVYLTYPTLKESKEVVPPFVMIDNQFLYEIATYMPREDYLIRFNKTIYDWIISMLPQSFNNEKSKFLSDMHMLFEPKLEFENWFMKNGLAINDCKNMFDDWDDKPAIALSDINKALKKNGKFTYNDEPANTLSKEDILQNENRVLVKKTKEQSAEIRLLKVHYKVRYRDLKEEKVMSNMTWDGIGRDEPVEISKLQEVVDTECRMKNGRFNKSALGKILGCNRDTAYNLLLEDKEYSFLLSGLDPTDKSTMKRVPFSNP